MMRVLAVGRLKDRFYRDACAEYTKRLGRYGSFAVHEVDDLCAPLRLSALQQEAVKNSEGEKLLRLLRPQDVAVVLDARGKAMDSTQLAAWIEQMRMQGKPHLSFLIGGSLGHGDAVVQRADLTLTLSPMTLPHALARLVLLEQLYRAETILRGEAYHK